MENVKRVLRRLFGKEKSHTRAARVWSNREISRLAKHAVGEVINVSAWLDEDKEGRHYKDYFVNATGYYTSNYQGWRGIDEQSDFVIDLQLPAPTDCLEKFDLVFNHTTLEHIFNIHQAFRTLATMSRDSILIVVPFMQHLHGPVDGDFWRPSPYAIRKLCAENGFEVCYESAGPIGGKVRYYLFWASRAPEKWRVHLPKAAINSESILRKPL